MAGYRTPNQSQRVYEEMNFTETIGSKLLNDKLEDKGMNNNGIGSLSWINVKSALVYGLLALILYVISTGSVFGLDWQILVNTFVMGVLTSFVKNFLTTEKGNFAGVVKVVDEPVSK